MNNQTFSCTSRTWILLLPVCPHLYNQPCVISTFPLALSSLTIIAIYIYMYSYSHPNYTIIYVQLYLWVTVISPLGVIEVIALLKVTVLLLQLREEDCGREVWSGNRKQREDKRELFVWDICTRGRSSEAHSAALCWIIPPGKWCLYIF